MTTQEFYHKYGDEIVLFSSYWKYEFSFEGDNVSLTIGGDAGEIYKFDVDKHPITVKEILNRYGLYNDFVYFTIHS